MVFTGTSGNLSVALYLASLAEVGRGRTLTRIEITAIAWGVNIASGIINTIGTRAIGGMSSFSVWWTLGGTFVLVITLLVKAPVKASRACVALWLHAEVHAHRTPQGLYLQTTRSKSSQRVRLSYSVHVALQDGATRVLSSCSASCKPCTRSRAARPPRRSLKRRRTRRYSRPSVSSSRSSAPGSSGSRTCSRSSFPCSLLCLCRRPRSRSQLRSCSTTRWGSA